MLLHYISAAYHSNSAVPFGRAMNGHHNKKHRTPLIHTHMTISCVKWETRRVCVVATRNNKWCIPIRHLVYCGLLTCWVTSANLLASGRFRWRVHTDWLSHVEIRYTLQSAYQLPGSTGVVYGAWDTDIRIVRSITHNAVLRTRRQMRQVHMTTGLTKTEGYVGIASQCVLVEVRMWRPDRYCACLIEQYARMLIAWPRLNWYTCTNQCA
jgi:hypothetical protein